MSDFSDEVLKVAVTIGLDGWLDAPDVQILCAAIYEAGVKKGKSVPMKYRRMEFNAQLQEEVAIERAVSDRLLEVLQEVAEWCGECLADPAFMDLFKQYRRKVGEQ